jgi:hypothetical protein
MTFYLSRMITSKSNYILCILKVTDEKSRIRISEVRTRGSGSVPVPKCLGFTTLATDATKIIDRIKH